MDTEHTLADGDAIEVKHGNLGWIKVFVWRRGDNLRVSIIGPVYPQLEVTPKGVEEVPE